jgi:aryl-phospho-beta-D-glucosidase BglC (GH1 family)
MTCSSLLLLLLRPLAVDGAPKLALRADNGAITANGQPLIIKGVSWFGLEGPDAMLGGLAVRELDRVLDFLQAHGFNAIRLPLSVHNILANARPAPTAVSDVVNTELRSLPLLQMLDELLKRTAKRGLLLLLDMHLLNASGPVTKVCPRVHHRGYTLWPFRF